MMENLVAESSWRRISDRVLSASRAEHTLVRLSDGRSSTLRFANNQAVQNVAVRGMTLTVEAAFGKRVGRAQTNRLDEASLRATVRQAEDIARHAPEDPEYLPPLPPQRYDSMSGFAQATADARPLGLAEAAKPVVERCAQQGLIGAGILSTDSAVRGVAASSGLFAWEPSTEARFSLTASGEDSSGWTLAAHRDLGALRIAERGDQAIAKAISSRSPRELAAGHYRVILEPAAVAGIVGPMLWSLNAKRFYKGNSPFVGKLGSQILDAELTVRTEPAHASLLGSSFAEDGLRTHPVTWVERGVLRRLHYDRFTASERGVEPTPPPRDAVMEFAGSHSDGVEGLIAGAERAILITNFWYIRSVDASDLTLTGMTRDGTFLVENGQIVCGVRNFRFHDSPLRCLLSVEAATGPMESVTMERGKMLLPALRLPDFYLSSVTEF